MNEIVNKRKRLEYYRRKSKFCLQCSKITTNKFCNQKCQKLFETLDIFKKIENNTCSFKTEQTANRWFKKYLIHLHGEKCMECGWCKMNLTSRKIPIELEHIDGNSENNSIDNLKLLCPNCHSLTKTYKGLNYGKGRANRRLRYKNGKSF